MRLRWPQYPYTHAILSGLLVGTSYIPFPPWAIFFCFIPLWLAWFNENSVRQIFWTGWLTQFVFTFIGFNWVSYTVYEFGHLPIPVAGLTLLLFCSFANLYVPLVGVVWFYFSKKLRLGYGAKVLSLAVFMSIGERIFPMIFDWHFGYTWLWAGFPAFHLADTFGFIGLSNLGDLFNAALLWGWHRHKEGKKPWPQVALVVGSFVILNGLGYWHGRNLEIPNQSVRMLIVQPSISNQDKLAAEAGDAYRDVVFDRFANLTRQAIQEAGSPDYVVWPETAFPEVIPEPTLKFGYANRLKSLITEIGTRLITGGYSVMASNKKYTNSFFILDAKGEWLVPPYHKTILLAFGEYLPLGEQFPVLYRLLPEVADFGRGPGPTTLLVEKLRVGAQICYEGLFDWFTRSLANQGSNIVVNVTNDSWYGTWEQPYQHLYMTLARAIEVRRPLVRATNTGISGVILANGQIMTLSPLHKEWFHLYDIPYVENPRATLFMGVGYWFLPGLLALSLIGMICFGRTKD
ncbi:MAG: apolipoprotein N-acyltransferase [Bdellovibrionales bacterium]